MKFNLQYFAENDEVETETEASTVETEKTLTQDEVNRLIAQSKSKAKAEAEKSFQSKLDEIAKEYESKLTEVSSKLSDQDREAFDLEKAKNQIKQLEADLQRERDEKLILSTKITKATITEQAVSLLNEKGLSTSEDMLALVVKDSAEDTVNAIEAMAHLFAEKKKTEAQSQPPFGSGGMGNTQHKSSFDILDGAKQTPL